MASYIDEPVACADIVIVMDIPIGDIWTRVCLLLLVFLGGLLGPISALQIINIIIISSSVCYQPLRLHICT